MAHLINHLSRRSPEASSGMRGGASSVPENLMVSIVIPMRNESEHIRGCLDSLLRQTYEANSYEVIVVDGRSSDGSSQIVRSMQSNHPNLLLIDNPSGITPVGMNLGILKATNKIIVIAGAHAIYSSEFLRNCVEKLRETGADVVGGPITTIPADYSLSARLAAAVLSSPFGVGNSHFRTSLKEGYVDTVPFGAFRVDVLRKVGLFNEKLLRNQDNDLSARIRSAGGKIYFSPTISAHYISARSVGELLRQTYKKAQWHLFTLRQNISALSLRHLTPALFLIFLVCLTAAAINGFWARIALLSVLLTYFMVGFSYSLRERAQIGPDVTLFLPLACLLFHFSYGIGTLVGFRYLVGAAPTKPIRSGLPIQ
jgi:cellulose synthase/poly-beta-1,6-N-acetylglucosamine synthase-like glycosyltransferase